MENEYKDTTKELPEDKVIFAPFDEIKVIKNVIDKLETALRELKKVSDGMKPLNPLKGT